MTVKQSAEKPSAKLQLCNLSCFQQKKTDCPADPLHKLQRATTNSNLSLNITSHNFMSRTSAKFRKCNSWTRVTIHRFHNLTVWFLHMIRLIQLLCECVHTVQLTARPCGDTKKHTSAHVNRFVHLSHSFPPIL